MTNPNQTPGAIKISRGLLTDFAEVTHDVIDLSGLGERKQPTYPTKIVKNLELNPQDMHRIDRIVTVEPIKIPIPVTVGDIEVDTIDRVVATPRESKLKDLAIYILLERVGFFMGAGGVFREDKKFQNGYEPVTPKTETAVELIEAMYSFKGQLEYRLGHVALAA